MRQGRADQDGMKNRQVHEQIQEKRELSSQICQRSVPSGLPLRCRVHHVAAVAIQAVAWLVLCNEPFPGLKEQYWTSQLQMPAVASSDQLAALVVQ